MIDCITFTPILNGERDHELEKKFNQKVMQIRVDLRDYQTEGIPAEVEILGTCYQGRLWVTTKIHCENNQFHREIFMVLVKHDL